uniref:Rha n=1 Tax=Drosophila melanogaster TaxID=7227 RepID=Q9VBR7_DROME|nr:rha [Drosophila melanogaster]AAF56461.1 rha [Drosophila melanogaster]|eukprot:NP_651390.2 rha [Drosophila melanogaster]
MVKPSKAPRSMTASGGRSGGRSGSVSSKDSDQVYCVLLHVVEAINFIGRDATDRQQIVMNAALNSVDFEVEGTQSEETIIFNSNCIWECDLAGIKRLKTDHRPVKMTFYACRGGGAERKTIGTLLLPVRGLPVLGTVGSHNSPHLKMFWHKLICTSSEFRSHKPEVLLMLTIIKKSILHTKDFEHFMQFTEVKSPPTPPMQSPGHSITASMLQSQANVYVQSLVQLGLLQVGNDPLVDCDIIEVVLQLKQLRNVTGLVKSLNQGKPPSSVILVFDFVGNVTNIELKLNESDTYTLNDVLGLRFKTSLRSMRLYFQRIFYLPINMYMNGTAIAHYRMDFTNLLPADDFFSDNRKYTSNGSFSFNRFGRTDSGREPKPPLMEYTFSVDLKTIFSRQEQEEPERTPSIASGNLDSEDEQYLGQTFCASVVRSRLNLNESEETDEIASNVMKQLANDSETEVIEMKSNTKNSKHNTSPQRKSQESKKLIRESSRNTRNSLENLQNVDELTSLDLFELEEKRQEKIAELERIKAGQSESLLQTELKVKKHKKADLELQGKKSQLETINEVPPKSLRKSKPVSQSELNNVPKIQENLPILNNQTKGSRIQKENCEENNEDLSYALSEEHSSSNEKLDKKPGASKTMRPPEHVDTDLETDISVFSIQKKRKSKSKLVISNELHNFEDSSTDTLEKGRPNPSKGDLKLRARWVEVNKVQTQALIETEKFLQKTCPAELDEVLYEDQVALGQAKTSKPTKRKVKKPEEDKVKRIDYETSYEEEITFCHPEKDPMTMIGENPINLNDLASSEEYISISEGNSKPAEIVYTETEQRVTFVNPKRDREKKKLSSLSKDDLLVEVRSEEYINLRSSARSKTDCVRKKKKISIHEDQVYQAELTPSEEPSSQSESRGTDNANPITDQPQVDRVKKKKRDTSGDQQLFHVEYTSSQKSISKTEGNVKCKELIEPDVEQTDVQVLKKKKLKKTLVTNDTVAQDYETLEEETIKPVKKKIVRKKSSVILEKIEDTENKGPADEVVSVEAKKIIKKKAKPACDNPTVEEYPKTKKGESRKLKSTSKEHFTMEKPSSTIDSIGQKIKSWRRQQIDLFEQELARKEMHYIKQLEQMESQEARLHQLHKADTNLDETFISKIPNVSEVDYEAKFTELEEHIALLKSEMEEQVRLFENRSRELRQENLQLYSEKTELKVRIAALEQQIGDLKAQGSDEGDLKEVLGELRSQHYRYNNLAREKELFRKRWRRSAKRVHALKLAMYERSLEREHSNIRVEPIDLRKILTKDAEEFEREYGQFRQNGMSPRYTLNSLSGSGDFAPPNRKRMVAAHKI